MEETKREDFEIDTASESDIEIPPLERNANGRVICPGHPKMCLWSGSFPGFDCLCDECDYRTQCFPKTAQ